jgi:hypothetical protein
MGKKRSENGLGATMATGKCGCSHEYLVSCNCLLSIVFRSCKEYPFAETLFDLENEETHNYASQL